MEPREVASVGPSPGNAQNLGLGNRNKRESCVLVAPMKLVVQLQIVVSVNESNS